MSYNQKFARAQSVRVSLAPQTTPGDKRAFDMRPKVMKDPRYVPRVNFSGEPESVLLDDSQT